MAAPARIRVDRIDTTPFQGSNYVFCGYRKRRYSDHNVRVSNGDIRVYRLINNNINAAIQTIVTLLNANNKLCPIFNLEDLDALRHQMVQKKYLIINRNALCLSEWPEPPDDIRLEYRDSSFSGSLIREPIFCTRGHLFDRVSAQFWIARKGDVCPELQAGQYYMEHQIGPLNVNEPLQAKIEQFRIKHEKILFLTPRFCYRDEDRLRPKVLADFLQYTGYPNSAYVSALGIHPDQIEKNVDQEWIRMDFRRVYDRVLPRLDQWQKERFLLFYPSFAESVLGIRARTIDEIVNEEVAAALQPPADNPNAYPGILEQLSRSVIGQPRAVERVASLLASQRNIQRNQLFLFVGPSGVGKTELARAAAKVKQDRFVNFSMNQYQTEPTVATFFGTGGGSGLVGSTDKPLIAREFHDKCNPVEVEPEGSKKVYEIRDAVILFDEFEKAHPRLKQSMLSLFDDTFSIEVSYTDGVHGPNITIKYNLKKCVIICTSNLFQQAILEGFNQGLPFEQLQALFRGLNLAHPTEFSYSPELLSRMEIIPFGPIPRGEAYQQILKIKLGLFLKELKDEFSFREVILRNEPEILLFLENRLYVDGVNMRIIAQHLSSLRVFLQEYSANWGDLRRSRLIISYVSATSPEPSLLPAASASAASPEPSLLPAASASTASPDPSLLPAASASGRLFAETEVYVQEVDMYFPTGRRVRLSRE